MLKRSACLYTSNSGVGLTADVSLIQDLLIDEYDIDVVYTQYDIADPSPVSIFANYDVGIFFQEYDIEWLDRNKVNILIWPILSINQSIITPTINYKKSDPGCDLNYTPNNMINTDVNAVMSNSFGFGGHNAVLIFQDYLL